jgi:hypothetical protein
MWIWYLEQKRCMQFIEIRKEPKMKMKNDQENIVFTKLFLMKNNSFASALASAMKQIVKVVLGEKFPTSIINTIQKKFNGRSLLSRSITRVFSQFWSYVHVLDILLENLLTITLIQQIHSTD